MSFLPIRLNYLRVLVLLYDTQSKFGSAFKEQYHMLPSEYRECHIQPDWLLVYRYEDDVLVLTLTRTGTHSDLFNL